LPVSGFLSNFIVQAAGVVDLDEALMLAGLDLDLLGFPLRLDTHKPDLSEDMAARIIRALPPGPRPVLITYLDRASDILDLCGFLGVDAVQVHGPIEVSQLRALKAARPGLLVIKSLVVRGDNLDELLARARDTAEHADMFITDTFDPRTGASGATGKIHDRRISRVLVERAGRPVILAGGLNPGNVRPAVMAVNPAGVDAHTGLEGPDGRKDRDLVKKFISEARKAHAEIVEPR